MLQDKFIALLIRIFIIVFICIVILEGLLFALGGTSAVKYGVVSYVRDIVSPALPAPPAEAPKVEASAPTDSFVDPFKNTPSKGFINPYAKDKTLISPFKKDD